MCFCAYTIVKTVPRLWYSPLYSVGKISRIAKTLVGLVDKPRGRRSCWLCRERKSAATTAAWAGCDTAEVATLSVPALVELGYGRASFLMTTCDPNFSVCMEVHSGPRPAVMASSGGLFCAGADKAQTSGRDTRTPHDNKQNFMVGLSIFTETLFALSMIARFGESYLSVNFSRDAERAL